MVTTSVSVVTLVPVVPFRWFRWFRWFRSGGFAGSGGSVPVVTLVPVVPFRWFRSVVPGFTTCRGKVQGTGSTPLQRADKRQI